MTTYILLWVLVWSILAFALMGIDKWRAASHGWRIPEKTLFLTAALGGSLGAILGMQLFRHKTMHWSFKLGMPAILVVQVVLALGLSWWSAFGG
jgi:uncharacterized membrane protein YsdA (DUF1294 family)